MKLPHLSLERFKKRSKRFEQEVKIKTFTYITAALGFVAGLAWNEAIKTLIETWFPGDTNSVIAKFIYAFVITIMVVILTSYVVKGAKK